MGLTTHVVRGANAERLLLLVHGLGADERDLAGLLQYLDPDGRFVSVFPRGPYSAPPGYAWFKFGGPSSLTSGTMQSSLDGVDNVLDESCLKYGMRRGDAVVGGFSQGCMLSLALAFRKSGRDRPAGVLAMSGALPSEGIEYDWSEPDTLPPVLQQHGTEDPLIPVDAGRAGAEALAAAGVPVVYKEYPMGHQVALESVRDAKEWLDRVRAGERPSEAIGAGVVPEGPVKRVTSRTFEQEVLRSELPVIVDFWAPWCQPCRQVAPVVEAIARMREGRYKVVKVNIDECPDLAQTYEIQSIPLVGMFRNGKLERKSLGAKPRQQLEADLGMLVIP